MTYEIDEGDDGSLTVSVNGELDITNVNSLGSAVAAALEQEPSRLIVDVRDLGFADSSAIALWVQWAAVVPEIELRDVSPLLRRVVESMGLAQTLNVKP